jgi:hypothetical protein
MHRFAILALIFLMNTVPASAAESDATWVSVNLPEYPSQDIGEGFVEFYLKVRADATPYDFVVIDGVGQKAYRDLIVKSFEKSVWKPAKKNGYAVESSNLSLRIAFRHKGETPNHENIREIYQRALSSKAQGNCVDTVNSLQGALRDNPATLYEITMLEWVIVQCYNDLGSGLID